MLHAAAPTLVFLRGADAAAPLASPARGDPRLLQFSVAGDPGAAADVAAAIRGLGTYILAGHGAGAAMAAVLARRAEDGEAGLEGLDAVTLLGAALGKEEGLSRRVGVLRTPALLVGARDEEGGGADRLRSQVAPHFMRARLRMVSSFSEPVPLGLLRGDGHEEECLAAVPAEPEIDKAYSALIASDRVTERTRAILLERAKRLPPSPVALTPPLLAILRAAVRVLLPVDTAFDDEPGRVPIDAAPIDMVRVEIAQVNIARRIDQLLAGTGDGWRHAALPADAVAAERGLRTLDAAAGATHGRPFICLDATAQAALLDRAERGQIAGELTAEAMTLWLDEVRREAARQWIAHPATLGRLGYSGVASVRPDDPTTVEPSETGGFARVGPDSTEAWEPRGC